MDHSLSERRLAENEVFFRQSNEQVEQQLESLKEIATEEGKQHLVDDESNTLFHFYCECSDENCQKRILLTLNEYITIHKKRDHFVIIPMHDVTTIENVVQKQSRFWTVKKFVPVPEVVSHLNQTPIQNT